MNNRLVRPLRWVGISLIILSVLPCILVLLHNVPHFSWGFGAFALSVFVMPLLLGLGILSFSISLFLSKKRIAATILVCICLVVFVLSGLFLRKFFFFAVSHAPAIPEQLERAGVPKGEGSFAKDEFYVRPELGVITDFASDQSGQSVIAGLKGAAFIGTDHNLIRVVSFEACDSSVSLVMRNDGSAPSFLCRGSWSQSARLSSADGKTLWTYAGNASGVDDAVAVNFGGTETQYVIGFNGDGGVHMLDSTGKLMWRSGDGNVWHVEVVNDGVHPEPLIVHSNARGVLTIRDRSGSVLRRNATDVYLAYFTLVSWGADSRRDKLITSDAGHVYVIGLDGKTIATLTSGVREKGGDAKTYGTSFETSGRKYFAVLQHYELWNRSLLEIFDAQNQPVYEEVFAESCGALQALENSLIVGCDGKVWKYTIRDTRITHN